MVHLVKFNSNIHGNSLWNIPLSKLQKSKEGKTLNNETKLHWYDDEKVIVPIMLAVVDVSGLILFLNMVINS